MIVAGGLVILSAFCGHGSACGPESVVGALNLESIGSNPGRDARTSPAPNEAEYAAAVKLLRLWSSKLEISKDSGLESGGATEPAAIRTRHARS